MHGDWNTLLKDSLVPRPFPRSGPVVHCVRMCAHLPTFRKFRGTYTHSSVYSHITIVYCRYDIDIVVALCGSLVSPAPTPTHKFKSAQCAGGEGGLAETRFLTDSWNYYILIIFIGKHFDDSPLGLPELLSASPLSIYTF